jgi:hypothetical protein
MLIKGLSKVAQDLEYTQGSIQACFARSILHAIAVLGVKVKPLRSRSASLREP